MIMMAVFIASVILGQVTYNKAVVEWRNIQHVQQGGFRSSDFVTFLWTE